MNGHFCYWNVSPARETCRQVLAEIYFHQWMLLSRLETSFHWFVNLNPQDFVLFDWQRIQKEQRTTSEPWLCQCSENSSYAATNRVSVRLTIRVQRSWQRSFVSLVPQQASETKTNFVRQGMLSSTVLDKAFVRSFEVCPVWWQCSQCKQRKRCRRDSRFAEAGNRSSV